MKVNRSILKIAASALTLLISGIAHAGIISTDQSVPASMNAGGTLADPASYIIGYVVEPGDGIKTVTHSASTTVGSSKPYNELVIQNGWSLVSEANSFVGAFYTGTPSGDQGIYNKVTVTGEGSNWTLPKMASITTLALGRRGYYNQLIVEDGGAVEIKNGYLRLGTEGGSGNSATITSGGKISTFYDISIGHGTTGSAPNITYPNDNNITVKDSGSILSSDGALLVGNAGTGNTLTIEDGALAKGTSLTIGAGNYLQLNQGYLALKLTQEQADLLLANLLTAEKIQIWNEMEWVMASESSLIATYYATNDDAFDVIGYEGLGGYTVITTAIPEPSAAAFLLIGLGGLALRLRRKTL